MNNNSKRNAPSGCDLCAHSTYCPHYMHEMYCYEEPCDGCGEHVCACPYPGYDISHSDIGYNGRSGG